MDFNLTQEQEGVREALVRYVRRHYGFEHRRALERERAYCPEAWRFLAEMGILGVALPEEAGGLGGSSRDVMVVMEEIGDGLMLEPYLGAVVLAGNLLACSDSGSHRHLLGELMSGGATMALAHFEPDSRYDAERFATRATHTGKGWTLTGDKSFIVGGGYADWLMVSARIEEPAAGLDREQLFLVASGAPGVTRYSRQAHDGTNFAEVRLDRAMVPDEARLRLKAPALAAIHKVLDQGTAALCGEAIGCMRALLRQTMEHLRTRHQFGARLGAQQALRHRVAEMAIELEKARSMALLAARYADSDHACVRIRAVSGAKAVIGEAARFVGQQAVQLHGGMGLTEELNIGHYFKRLTVIEATLGDTDYHLSRVAAGLRDEIKAASPPPP